MPFDILEELEKKEEEGLASARDYFEQVGIKFEDPWRVQYTGIVGEFEALFDYPTHSIVLNDAELMHEDAGPAMTHESLHRRHSKLAFGKPPEEQKNEVNELLDIREEVVDEAEDQNVEMAYIPDLGRKNHVLFKHVEGAAYYLENGEIPDNLGKNDARLGYEDLAREHFPVMMSRMEMHNEGPWMAASEIIANFADYHHSGEIDWLPRQQMLSEVRSTIRKGLEEEPAKHDLQEVESHALDQMNFILSVYEEMEGTGYEDQVAEKVILAGDKAFEDYNRWDGFPSLNQYVKEELSI